MKINIVSEIYFSIVKDHCNRTYKAIRAWLWCIFWKTLGISGAIAISKIPIYFGAESRCDRIRAPMWRENLENISGVECNIHYQKLMRRRRLFESALYHSDVELGAMMTECAIKLNIAREAVIKDGGVPILAPFHICSDAIATIIAAMVPPVRCHAYSIYEWGHFASDEAKRLSFFQANLSQYHPDTPPTQQRELFRELRAGLANILIFPDALPQLTSSLLGRVMRTRTVTLFGREARLHCGAEEIARIVGGKIIPFYVYWQKNGLEIQIFEPCKNTNELASCLELALQECGEQWMLWHFPSVFYFNDGGRVDAWRY